ncbi:hypothetical protein [Agrobacterium tumefaciens]|jgi:uncharacterized membrane protein YhdT|uniref:hypothetical protein n=1 Tax=Agrobacterium tumefaciens TaxID=358 RepID=UPI000470A600
MREKLEAEPEHAEVSLPLISVAILAGAVIFTILWVIGAGIFAYSTQTPEDPLGLNEWGDFVAGVAAPIAFIWLVVAVALQSIELREQRKELALTRAEFKYNRAVMKAQADEARKQAEFIEQQTSILKQNQETANGDDIFLACVDLVATRLRQYTNAWDFNCAVTITADGRETGFKMNLRTKTYEGMSDKLVIAKTVQMLRTQLRELRNGWPNETLYATYPYDFQRIYKAVMISAEKIESLPESFQLKSVTLELDELKEQMVIIANKAGITPFDPVSQK